MNDPALRLAAIVSHPIQYQAPLFRALAAIPGINLRVFFCCKWGIEGYLDPEFKVNVAWDVPLLDGYHSTFLKNVSPSPGPDDPLGLINPGVVARIMNDRFDAIWIHGWSLATNWMAIAAASMTHIPILLRGESNGLSEPTGPRLAVKRAVLKMLFARIAGFLAIGTYNRDFYRSYGVPKERIFSTPYAVDNDFFFRSAAMLAGHKRELRERERIAPELPLTLFSGKLIERKGPMDLLQAFASLPNGGAALAFAGDGPLRGELERFVQDRHIDNVHFFGFRNQTEMPACYAMADALVLPSASETWGLAINEAMCFGLPIIASDKVGATADLVKDGFNGFVYPAHDLAKLAQSLQVIISERDRRREMGCRSREIINQWGIRENVQGILDGLRYVTAAHS
jgi:glycosyltransferase involved in cell wall biosynthesis